MQNMLTFRNILLLFLVSDMTYGGFLNIDMKKCLKRNGVFPKKGSYCKSYYECTNWVPVEIMCPKDELFNPIIGWCDWIEAFTCLDKPKRKECPRESGKFLKPDTKCKSYYDCCNGEPTELTCPSDTLFDPNKEKCEWPEMYACIEDISTKDISSSTLNPFLKSSTNEVNPTDTTYETSQYPEISSPPTTFAPYTQSTTDIERLSSLATDTTYETSQYPEISSPPTTFVPYTQSTTDDEQLSSKATDYETSQYPETSRTSDPVTQYTEEKVKSTSSFTSVSDYETSQYPDGSSYRTPYPYTRSTIGEIRETTTTPPVSTTSYGTFQPYTKTSIDVGEETSEPVDIWCPEPSGYFPHPNDKHKFIGCVDGKPNVMDCPSNLVYNHKVRRCVYK